METIRYFGVFRAEVNDQAKSVVMRYREAKGEIPQAQLTKVAEWAISGVRDLEAEGFEIDTSGISEFLENKQ